MEIAWKTVYDWIRRWRIDGTWERFPRSEPIRASSKAFSKSGLLSRRRWWWRYFETILLADLHDPSYVRLALGRR